MNEILLPQRLMLSPVSFCNSKCLYCTYWHEEIQKEVFDLIKGKEIISNFNELSKMSIPKNYEVNFAGQGEPLLHRNIWELIKYTSQNKLFSSLTTNSILLNEKAIPNIINSELDMIIFSINGLAKEHDYSRGVEGNYNHIMNFVEILNNYKEQHNLKKPIFAISSFIGDFNYYNYMEFLNYMEATGYFDSLCFCIVTDVWDKSPWLVYKKEIIELIKACQIKYKNSNFIRIPQYIYNNMYGYIQEEKKYKTNFYCKSALFNLNIDTNLNVTNCFASDCLSYGNLHNKTLKEIMLSKFSQKIMEKKCKGICTMWCATAPCFWQ